MKNKVYAVIGLGRYGQAVAKELVNSGAEVLAVDINEAIVNDLAADIPVCKCADITDPAVFHQLGIDRVDTAIIAMASDLEASVMAITLCKEAGVGTVVVKCATNMQKVIYTRVGADQTVLPENESGVRLAKNLLSAGFVDMLELSKDVCMVEIDVKAEWVGKSLVELKLRNKYDVNVVAILNNETAITAIDPTMPLTAGMRLIVIANVKKLEKLAR
ncbi:MAG: TrkA family potassium uptake protein [Clostridia bacterium]|nr:TrkA family potassium uptake protein [Clostridia bacterium]